MTQEYTCIMTDAELANLREDSRVIVVESDEVKIAVGAFMNEYEANGVTWQLKPDAMMGGSGTSIHRES